MRLLLIAFLTSSACADPCHQVAEQVCACRANSSLERSCLAEVDAAREAHPASEEASLACEAIIQAKSCTCDALALGEAAACGLAQNP